MAINLGSTAVADFKLGDTQVEKICLGDTVVWQKVRIKALKFSSTGSQTLGVVTGNLGSISPNFEYSTDEGATWTTWDVSQTISFGNGTDLYVRGMNTFLAKASTNYTQFVFSTASPVECSGNVMHLFDYTQDLTAFPDDGNQTSRGVKYMFQNCTALTTAPDLPATTALSYCYYYMFAGCTSLTSAPALPATTLVDACYSYMFQGCTALTTAPELPATTLANSCYSYMFQGCTSLSTPPIIAATSGAQQCFRSMFQGCTALTTAPNLLVATATGGSLAYESMMLDMFNGCTNLESLPLIRIVQSDSATFNRMFQGCTKIKMSLTQEGDYQNTYSFLFTPSSSNASDMFTNTGGTFTGTPTQQTLYTSNTIVS